MQGNQPFFGTGYPPTGPFPAYNTHVQYPEVIGEGEIKSLVLPNGSIEHYFLPTIKWRYTLSYPNFPSYINPYNDNGVWLVRSISDPVPHPLFHQQNMIGCGGLHKTFPNICNNNGNIAPPGCQSWNMNARPASAYQYKFHNDNWTSTTDLHYFCPRVCPCSFPQKVASVVQVAVPMEHSTSPFRVVIDKHCQYSDTNSVEHEKAINLSCMSSEIKPERSTSTKAKTKKHKCVRKVYCDCQLSSGSNNEGSSQSRMSIDEERHKRKSKKDKTGTKRKKEKRHHHPIHLDENISTSRTDKPESTCVSSEEIIPERQNSSKNKPDTTKRKKIHECECYLSSSESASCNCCTFKCVVNTKSKQKQSNTESADVICSSKTASETNVTTKPSKSAAIIKETQKEENTLDSKADIETNSKMRCAHIDEFCECEEETDAANKLVALGAELKILTTGILET